MEKDELILVLSLHPLFGWKFNARMAEPAETGYLHILGSPSLSEEKAKGRLSTEQLNLIALADDMSDQALMHTYSKKKDFAEFKKELSRETVDTYIRPHIESNNRKMLELVRQTDTPVFLREKMSGAFLHENSRLHLAPSHTECLFNFVKDEKGFRYFIVLSHAGREISLQTQPVAILSEKPSVVLIGDEIHCVENIESKKLQPFFDKAYVEVPPRSESIYLKTFVKKVMRQYEVRLKGIPLQEVKPEKEAILTLEKDFNNRLVLLLWFKYGKDGRIRPDQGRKKVIWIGDDGKICYYQRDEVWETDCLGRLERAGLTCKRTNHYVLKRDSESAPYSLLEWLHQNDGHLPGFRIEQALEQKYFLGNIRVEAEIEEKIDWFDLHIVAVIGDERIPFQRFRRQILNGNRDFLLPDGKLLVLPEAWFRKYAALFKLGKEEKEGFRMRKIHAVLLKDMLAGDISPKKEEALKQLLTPPASPPAIPPGIKAKLRNYQKMGFQWLAHLYENGFGGCLADDMGLGKTLQSICLLQYVYQRIQERDTVEADGQLSFFQTAQTTTPASLIIVPTSLLHNWKNELQRFAPCLHTLVYNGNNRLKQPLHFEHYQAVLTSYGIVRKDIASLSTYPFQLLILDESQYIKNPESQIYKAVRQLQAASRFALTGTPLENSLEDLWAQFNFVNEGLLGDYHTFKETFMQPIKEKDTEKELLLKKMLRPFLLRRTKEEVTPELPLLSQEIVYCEMTEVHREAYEKEKNRIRNQMLAEKEDSANQKDRQRWNILALQGLNLLRQLANHPKMVDADYKGDSGKMNEIFRRLEILKAGGHKVLIFSSYVKQLKLVEHAFIEKNWKYALLTGQTFHREEEIRRFSQQEDCFCFLISLKAGSTGLNLTAADYAFILDPWWNPAAEMQALARAHRIGQTKPVIACRFISFNTIEEKILLLQAGKKDLYDTFVNTPYGNMPNQEELIQMFLD